MTTVARYLAGWLGARGVRGVFFVPTILSRTLVAIEQAGHIRRVMTHGEQAAATMADGYARATGDLGVCCAQMIGTTGLASGLRDARHARSAVLALTGGSGAATAHRSQYQQLDGQLAFRDVGKATLRVDSADRFPELLAQAAGLAVQPVPGPVVLELPGHHGDEIEGGFVDPAVADRHLRHATRPHAPVSGAADEHAVARAAELLTGARRPVVLAGGGARTDRGRAAVAALAQRMAWPVVTSLTGKDVLLGAHPCLIGVAGLYARQAANDVLGNADAVVAVGSELGSQVTLSGRLLAGAATVVDVGPVPSPATLSTPGWLALTGDAAATVAALDGVLDARAARPDWLAAARARRDAWHGDQPEPGDALTPPALVADLGAWLPDDALVVCDTGHAGMWAAAHLELRGTGQRFLRAAGTLGWALPAGIGAAVAGVGPVVVLTGDGGAWYHIQELETAVRYGIPLVVVINDNAGLNQEIPIYADAYGGELTGRHEELWTFSGASLAAVAQAMGCTATTVRSRPELRAALAAARDADHPVVIDALTPRACLAPPGRPAGSLGPS